MTGGGVALDGKILQGDEWITGDALSLGDDLEVEVRPLGGVGEPLINEPP